MKFKLKLFEEFINSVNEAARVETKDWDRMLDLVMKNDEGEKAAKLIKDKEKAISRFIAGLKLAGAPLKYDSSSRTSPYRQSQFSDLGNKAIELGATPEEIEELYNTTEAPLSFIEKMTRLGGKKLNNRFVGSISKAILDSGNDITYLPHNGNALTMDGKHAMQRNGRKWTIGYKSQIDLKDRKVNLSFDAITDEGDGPTYFVLGYDSDEIFKPLRYKTFGKNEFISILKSILQTNESALNEATMYI